MKCYRWMLKKKWYHFVKNIEIRKRLNIANDIVSIIEKRQMKWFGHVGRMNNIRWAKRIITANFEGKRPRGKPRTRWFDNIQVNLGKKTKVKEAIETAQDRNV